MNVAPTPAAPAQQQRRVGNGRNHAPRNQTQGRLNHMNIEEAQEATDVVLGMFPINSIPARVLFDSGASHSFVTESFAYKSGITPTPMRHAMRVQIPGSITEARWTCQEVPIEIHGVEFLADLIVLGTRGLEVVLGMNWMSRHQGVIDCAKKTITMTSSTRIVVKHVSVKPSRTTQCHKSISGPTLEQVPIVCEYPDVFPDELPSMPPERDNEFIIELIPGTGPIAQRPYRMNPAELVELKKQLDDLLSKGLIRPSSSSWRSPVFFVDKSDGSS
jgi:hypothetical protein